MPDYREDLAYIHHVGHGEFAESSAPWVIEVLCGAAVSGGGGSRRRRRRRHTVIDVGCGSGILARELTRAGFDVLGIDASPAMIELARITAPEARFEIAPFETVELPPCDAIVAMGEVLNYGDLRAFLPRAAQALREGGVLLFDLAERGSYPAYDERRIGGDDWSVIAIKESDGKMLTRRVLTFRQDESGVRRDEEVHTLELYERSEVLELLRDFRVKVRRSYGKRRLPKGHFVYFATKRVRKSGGMSGHASFVRPNTR